MEIRRYVSDLLASNMYVIVEDQHAVVIDPCRDTEPAQDLTVDYMLLTHEHFDHISGVNMWKALTGAPVLCSSACAESIQSCKRNLANHFDDFCQLQTWIRLDELPPADPQYTCTADLTFEDRTELLWRGHTFVLFEAPGHSLGSVGIMLDGTDFFSGDSLMENSEIELRIPGGSRKKWREIGCARIEAIPEGTRIWPGHFESFILHRAV